nr:sugar phosphate isomerase/epimerase family protein [Parablautia intestinalis]
MIPEINRLSGQYKLPVVSLVHWQCTGNLLSSGSSQRISIEQTCEGLEIDGKVGAKCTLHTLGAMTPELYYDEAYENAVCSLKEIAAAAEKTGVAVAVEFMWNGYLFSPLEMKRFLDEIGSKFIGFYFDPGNMAAFQYPQHWARILGSDIKMVHMKDWKGNALSGGWPGLYYSNVKDQYRRGLYPGLAFIRIHRSCFDIYGSNC